MAGSPATLGSATSSAADNENENADIEGPDATTERDLQQRFLAQREMTAYLFHEFRNYLNVIQNSVDILYSGLVEESARSKALAAELAELRGPSSSTSEGGCSLNSESRDYFYRVAKNSCLHSSQLIENVMDFSKIQAGELVITPEPFDLVALTRNVFDINQFEDTSKLNWSLQMSLPQGMRHLMGSARHIQIVLNNLLANARKFTTAGEVKLAVSSEESLVRFTVSDTGKGVAPHLIETIFEPYKQGQAGQGTGLGLPLSSRLVSIMGGELRCQSEGAWKGSQFSFALPLFPCDKPDRPEETPGASIVRSLPSALRILYVDDSSANLKVVARLIDKLCSQYKLKWELTCSSTGEDGLRLIQERNLVAPTDRTAATAAEDRRPPSRTDISFDLVFLDQHLTPGGLTGTAVAKEVLRHTRLGRLAPCKLVACSGNVDDEFIASLPVGMHGALSKPFRNTELLLAIRRAFSGH